MKLKIKESQLKFILNEAKFKFKDLCSSLGGLSEFCTKTQNMLKDSKTGGKDENLFNLSMKFFKKVVTDDKNFKTVELIPDNPEFEKRLSQLNEFKNLLEKHNSCPEIIKEVKKDINNLPEKKLKMVVTDDGYYSLLNRLDTHYTAKGYLLTKIIAAEYPNHNMLMNISNEKLREILNYILQDKFVPNVSESLKKLLENDEEFKNYLFNALKESKKTGDQTEVFIANFLQKKYGNDNVILFSGDYGFVDYFGVDGVLIDKDGEAHPIQMSSEPKKNPKLFKFTSNSCKPLGFYRKGSSIMMYRKEQ